LSHRANSLHHQQQEVDEEQGVGYAPADEPVQLPGVSSSGGVHGPRQREPTKPRAPGDAVVHLQVGDREPAERTEQCEVVDPSRPEVEDPRGNTKTWGMRYTLFSHVMAIAPADWVKKKPGVCCTVLRILLEY
jgi:hypothetical protein